MSALPVVVVGDALLDRDVQGSVSRVCPDSAAAVLDQVGEATRPGGAALAAALAARHPGTEVVLVTAIGSDAAGGELRALLGQAGVTVVDASVGGCTPEKIRMRCGDQSLLRLDRGSSGPVVGPLPAEALDAVERAGAVLVSDYGRGMADQPALRSRLALGRAPVVWDPHPRGAEPVAGTQVVTPNLAELARRFGPVVAGGPQELSAVADAARRARAGWSVQGVAVTRGERGVLWCAGDDPPLAVAVPAVRGADACGAGDCFAAAVAVAMAEGDLPSEAVVAAAGHAAAFVAAGGATSYRPMGAVDPGPAPLAGGADGGRALDVAESVRTAGGTVVAAGGCFDILHAGHVALLQAARALGDCLIVCLNSDASVTRLKGPGRPLNPAADRALTLAALDCVDAVAIFEEDTPVEMLRRIQPHVWAKGGDYDARRLPEAEVLSGWGGQAVILPYLDGRSTTGLLHRAAAGRP